MIPHEDKLLKPKEAARLLGIHPLTLYRWAKSGKIRCVRTPTGRYLYPLSEIHRILGIVSKTNVGVVYIRVPKEIARNREKLNEYLSKIRESIKNLQLEIKDIIIDDEPMISESLKFKKLIKLLRKGEITHVVLPQTEIISPLCKNLIKLIFEEGFGVKVIDLNMKDPVSEQVINYQLIDTLIRTLSSKKRDLMQHLLK